MAQGTFDVTRKFVRKMGTLASGLVEFEFAVGDPDTCVELVMPEAAFEEFCRNNQVEFLGAVAASATESATADFKWGMRQATNQRFR